MYYVKNFMVTGHFKNVDDEVEWDFAGVYGLNVDSRRSLLWDEMVGLHSQWDISWCFSGDFNIIQFPSDREWSSHYSQ